MVPIKEFFDFKGGNILKNQINSGNMTETSKQSGSIIRSCIFQAHRMKNFTINLSCLIYSRKCILLCNDFVYFEMGAGRGSPVNFFKEFYGYAVLCSRLEQINKEMILGIERLADIPHAVCLLLGLSK